MSDLTHWKNRAEAAESRLARVEALIHRWLDPESPTGDDRLTEELINALDGPGEWAPASMSAGFFTDADRRSEDVGRE